MEHSGQDEPQTDEPGDVLQAVRALLPAPSEACDLILSPLPSESGKRLYRVDADGLPRWVLRVYNGAAAT